MSVWRSYGAQFLTVLARCFSAACPTFERDEISAGRLRAGLCPSTLVVDKDKMSKGYAFAAYHDDAMLKIATNARLKLGLNGIQLGDKSLTVQMASAGGGGSGVELPACLLK